MSVRGTVSSMTLRSGKISFSRQNRVDTSKDFNDTRRFTRPTWCKCANRENSRRIFLERTHTTCDWLTHGQNKYPLYIRACVCLCVCVYAFINEQRPCRERSSDVALEARVHECVQPGGRQPSSSPSSSRRRISRRERKANILRDEGRPFPRSRISRIVSH